MSPSPSPVSSKASSGLAREHGAVSIFDETITGFRLAIGGAQELFGVTPDLACFGKGLANGYPLSAVAGRDDVMREFEEVFFSFTMGGERLSLAAAVASHREDPRTVMFRRHWHGKGRRSSTACRGRIDSHGCGQFPDVTGTRAGRSW